MMLTRRRGYFVTKTAFSPRGASDHSKSIRGNSMVVSMAAVFEDGYISTLRQGFQGPDEMHADAD
jgi:hypothetical protein